MTERPTLFFLIPAALLVIAVLPLPYGYYTLLRLVVTIAAVVAALGLYQARQAVVWTVIFMGAVALLFNPIITVRLDRSAWLPIDLGLAVFFTWLALSRRSWAGRKQ